MSLTPMLPNCYPGSFDSKQLVGGKQGDGLLVFKSYPGFVDTWVSYPMPGSRDMFWVLILFSSEKVPPAEQPGQTGTGSFVTGA